VREEGEEQGSSERHYCMEKKSISFEEFPGFDRSFFWQKQYENEKA
jgi:hypothetical protein